jgi:hypothetical protein
MPVWYSAMGRIGSNSIPSSLSNHFLLCDKEFCDEYRELPGGSGRENSVRRRRSPEWLTPGQFGACGRRRGAPKGNDVGCGSVGFAGSGRPAQYLPAKTAQHHHGDDVDETDNPQSQRHRVFPRTARWGESRACASVARLTRDWQSYSGWATGQRNIATDA